MKKWAKRIGLGALILVVGSLLIAGGLFAVWNRQHARDLEAQSKVLQTPRGPIEYAEVGQGTPVLLIHGSPGGYDQLLGGVKAARLADAGFRYIMPSRPGYLRTPLSSGETPQEQAQLFAALLTELGIDKVAVLAASGGGPSGLQFAIQNPNRISALILEEATTQSHPPPTLSSLPPSVQDFLTWLFGGALIANMQAVDPADKDISAIGTAVFDATIPAMERQAGLNNDLKQFSQLDNWPLNQIHCPTLILHGTADTNVPISDAEYAHAQIAGSVFIRLEGANHFMVVFKHRELDDHIKNFLKKLESN